MTEEYSFFNDVNGDRAYDMEAFALYFKQFLSNGLYHTNDVPALLVSSTSGLQTKMESGSAYIEGFMYRNTEDIIFVHETADVSNPRIDRIVLRLDRNLNARYIKAFVKKGTAATNPVAPILQRDAVVYEISLAQVKINASSLTITSVTDERLNPTVAGLVSSLITIPTDGFIQEWNAFMSEMNATKANYEQQIDLWTAEGNQDKINYQLQLTTWESQLNQDKLDYEASWNSWFDGIKNQIGVRILIGVAEPSGAVSGDLWLKTL